MTVKSMEQFLHFLDQFDVKIQFVKDYLESYKAFVSTYIKERYTFLAQTDAEIFDDNKRAPCFNVLKLLLRSHNNLFSEIAYLTQGVIFTEYQKKEAKEELILVDDKQMKTSKICEHWLLSQFDNFKNKKV